MTDPDQAPLLFLVLSSPEGHLKRCVEIYADGTSREGSTPDRDRTVELTVMAGGPSELADLLRSGSLKVTKGANLLIEYAQLIRKAATP